MAAPYSSVAVSGYNANPPADDGSATSANTVYWATIKSKLPDPLKTAIESMNTNLIAGFGRVLGGAGVSTTAVDYTIDGSTDQGKLVRATAASITLTTPDATSVLSPWVCAVLNNSSGTITVDGSGSQTIDGNANITLPAGGGTILFTDGTNWFTNGVQGTLVGKQLMYGDVLNATISESNATNAVTFALKTLAGTDPSATDPVVLCFRNSTVGTGNYVYRTITAAMSLVISSGSTMGFSSGIAGKLWLVIFDDAGTLRLGAVNCLSGTSIYPLSKMPIASSTAEGGAGGADSAHVIYTGTAVTSKPYLVLGYASYESGIATAGSWNASPTRIQLYGPGIPLPGDMIQEQVTITGTSATGTTTLPWDNTIPQSGEGNQFMTQAITPTSTSNLLDVAAQILLADSVNTQVSSALFQDSTANALVSVGNRQSANGYMQIHALRYRMLAGTVSATTFKVRSGGNSASTSTFNGEAGAQLFGGVADSFLSVKEYMG